MKFTYLLIVTISLTKVLPAQVIYPYPLLEFHLHIENQKVTMRYMDVAADKPNGKSIVLLHGKNFSGYYWKDIIPALSSAGYRVIIPDQPGWGRSDNPNIHYSFHQLASNTKLLLDSLRIQQVYVAGHSMGGMLATRFALMFPVMTEKLILENPIGLEDYKTFVPYQTIDKLFAKERLATYESYKKYQQSYFPEWKEEYAQYVVAQAEQLKDPEFEKIAFINAITYQMIYEQPVIYEVALLKMPVMIIIGQEDRTVVGKDQLSKEQASNYGQYPLLGKNLNNLISNSTLVEMKGVGHIPHIQEPLEFKKHLLKFIDK